MLILDSCFDYWSIESDEMIDLAVLWIDSIDFID